MKIKSVTAIILLAATGLVSGCGILNKLARNSSASAGAYSALLSKKEELANFQPSGELSGNATPKIKGKVVIVKKEGSGQAELDRFNWEGKFSDEPAGGKSSRFYPPEVYAKKPEEIDTLIKIECREHKGSDYYKKSSPGSSSELQSFAKTICDVSVIDYNAKTLLAKVQKGDESAPGAITLGEGGDSFYKVMEEIANYLKSIPLELIPRVKATPSGEVIAVAEIAKLFKNSKESISQYQDKEMTVTGWGTLSKTYNSILLYGSQRQSGVDYISCKIDPSDLADFAEIREYEMYKFTVIGKFDTKNHLMNLEQCRFINAEKMISK